MGISATDTIIYLSGAFGSIKICQPSFWPRAFSIRSLSDSFANSSILCLLNLENDFSQPAWCAISTCAMRPRTSRSVNVLAQSVRTELSILFFPRCAKACSVRFAVSDTFSNTGTLACLRMTVRRAIFYHVSARLAQKWAWPELVWRSLEDWGEPCQHFIHYRWRHGFQFTRIVV